MRRCLIVVGKAPVAGLVKTRLAADIGPAATLALYRCFLEDVAAIADALPECRLAFSFWPVAAAAAFHALRPDALLFPQHGADFGGRLLSAFEQASVAGYDASVLIGSDNPGLPAAYVAQAFAALEEAPTVLGPAEDGGYYLIGMRAPQPALFHSGIAWSTPMVTEQTRVAAARAGLEMADVPRWYDIDTLDDLRRLHADLRTAGSGAVAPVTRARLDALAADGLADLLAPTTIAARAAR
jgi:rSAM/selenodomain-associated transferase 1